MLSSPSMKFLETNSVGFLQSRVDNLAITVRSMGMETPRRGILASESRVTVGRRNSDPGLLGRYRQAGDQARLGLGLVLQKHLM